jgi:hypothetical protein
MKNKILIIITILLLTSCERVPIINYKGEIIKEKSTNYEKWYVLQKYDSLSNKYKTHTIYVYDVDFIYNVGDTIK